MCGIAGFLSAGPPAFDARAVIDAMTRTLSHRGPDGWGAEVAAWGRERKGLSALGHRRLKIIDLSEKARQPMVLEGEGLAITYNGEIYNYVELREELAGLGHGFASSSDTEVVLKAYVQWGVECFSRFNGMWAMAIHDRKAGCLVLARDRFGKKPLYYFRSGKDLVFGSEPKALLKHPAVPRRPNLDKVFRYIAGNYRYVDYDDASYFEGIQQVPRASVLVVGDDLSGSPRRYWSLDSGRLDSGITDSQAVARFRDLFVDSVRLRLRSDVPVGCMLSGGLDSTSITCVAHKILKTPISTFSGVTGDVKGVYDESDYIESVVRDTGADSHFLRSDPADIFAATDEMLAFHDEPICTVTWFSLYLIAKLVREAGMPVVLNGHGGDEIAGGYWDYYQYHFHDLAAAGSKEELAYETAEWSKNHGRDPAELDRYRAYIPGVLKGETLETSRFPDYSGLFLPEVAARFRKDIRLDTGFKDVLARRMASDLLYETVPPTLRAEDRNTMANSIESRSPMLDHRLVEFAFTLPGRFKMRNGLGKWIIREAMRGILPEDVRTRKDKAGFIAPADEWFRTVNRKQILDMVASESFRERRLFDIPKVSAMIQEHQDGVKNHQMVLWQLINLELWFRRFFPSKVAAG
ncbi:MAG: asparagine synthase (glutamine-hydrolyzing) [Elusimicrobiota bacterium]|jgi:asparagine synthase (glutamine-hydrolysing)